MKHTLLASTALVALTSAANAEITISGTARIGLVTTEGAAAVAADSTMSTTAAAEAYIESIDAFAKNGYVYHNLAKTEVASAGAAIDASIASFAAVTAAERLAIGDLRAAIVRRSNNPTSAGSQAIANIDLASLDAVIAAMDGTTSAAVAKAQDTTVGKNRVRISFAGSGTTDGGLTYGFSARADHSNTSTGGSQYLSGAFGKISMGDLNGGDEQVVGNLSGVGSSGAGSHQEFLYQSSAHNLGYSVSMAGVSFAATTDLVRGADATKTGSNTAYGIGWSGDAGGATVGIALGTSKIGNATEDSMSASVSMGGLSIKAVSHTNDNGPAVAAVAATTGGPGVAHVAATAGATNADTDTTGLSISYAMDAMSVTAYTRTESTAGAADKDYSGVGFTYNMGGATLKAGFVDANDISIMDFGINFSF
jgi:outer membrane protein OmpU